MALLVAEDLHRAQLEREAAADAAELQRITEPLPIDALVTDSAFALRDSEFAAIATFDAERDNPWLLALYAMFAVGVIALSTLWPWGFAS